MKTQYFDIQNSSFVNNEEEIFMETSVVNTIIIEEEVTMKKIEELIHICEDFAMSTVEDAAQKIVAKAVATAKTVVTDALKSIANKAVTQLKKFFELGKFFVRNLTAHESFMAWLRAGRQVTVSQNHFALLVKKAQEKIDKEVQMSFGLQRFSAFNISVNNDYKLETLIPEITKASEKSYNASVLILDKEKINFTLLYKKNFVDIKEFEKQQALVDKCVEVLHKFETPQQFRKFTNDGKVPYYVKGAKRPHPLYDKYSIFKPVADNNSVTYIPKRIEMTQTIVQFGSNRMAHFLPIEVGKTVIFTRTGKQPIVSTLERYTKAAMQLIIRDIGLLPYVVNVVKDEKGNKFFEPRTIYKYETQSQGDLWFVEDPYSKGKIYNITKDTLISNEDFKKQFEKSCIRYNTPQGSGAVTAGLMKQGAIMLFADNIKGFEPQKMLSELTYGASELIKTHGIVNRSKVAKAAIRQGQAVAPCTELGNIGNVAIFMNKFKDSKNYESADGSGFVLADHMAEQFDVAVNRIKVSPAILNGKTMQMRPYNFKVNALSVSKILMKLMLLRYGKNGIILLSRERARQDENYFKKWQPLFNEVVSGADNILADKIVVITDDYVGDNDMFVDYDNMKAVIEKFGVNFFSDLNGLKSTFDLRKDSKCNVLAISYIKKSTEDGINTSSQLINTLQKIAPSQTVSLIQRLTNEMMDSAADTLGFVRTKDKKGNDIWEESGELSERKHNVCHVL